MKIQDIERIKKMLNFAQKTYLFSKDATLDRLKSDEQYQYSLLYPLGQIGEVAIKLDESFKLRKEDIDILYPTVEWSEWRGFRNRLYHDYDSINFDIVLDMITDALPLLIQSLAKIIENFENGGLE